MKSFLEWVDENYGEEEEVNILSKEGYYGDVPDWLAPYIKENTPSSFKAVIPKNITREQTADERTMRWGNMYGNQDGDSVFDTYIYGDLPIDIKYMIMYFRHLFNTRSVSVKDMGSSFSVEFNHDGERKSLFDSQTGRLRPWTKEDSDEHGRLRS